MRLYKNLVLICLLVSISGCYSTGRQFERPNYSTLKLKQTTQTEIIDAYGQPYSYLTYVRNDRKIEQVQYSFHTAMGIAIGKGPIGRQATFYFSDGILIGYLYRSSFPGDSTDFNTSASKQIMKGSSTRRDVETILGPPSGEVHYPLTDSMNQVELRYYYVGPKGLGGIESKKLSIIIDNTGIVQDVNLSEEAK